MSTSEPAATASVTPANSQPLVPRNLLLAEDNEKLRHQFTALLESEPGLTVEATDDGRKALDLLTSGHRPYSVLLTDMKLPGLDGLELIEQLQKRNVPVTTIVFTAYGSIQDAVQAMRMGAYDFLPKPVDPDHLLLVVRKALRERAMHDELLYLREQMRERYSFQNVLSKNARMHAIFELIGNVSQTTTTVLIEGETGTGKEMIARAIHEASTRVRKGAFIPVNCAALPETLLESELFGHEKGAFTGAVGQRAGRFEMAQGGTLFLDELGEIPMPIQVKLLRVLQERRFERVGGTKSLEVDVRMVAATNRSLKGMVKKGTFREDLYYRVNVVRIELPPLRDRLEDIPLLAEHFTRKYARTGMGPKSISGEAMKVLLSHTWPGNIRELENVVERASVIAPGDTIEPVHLPPDLLAPSGTGQRLPFRISLDRNLPDQLAEMTRQFERAYIRKALKRARGNVGRCAQTCGLSRRSLSTKLAEYDIDKKEFKRD